MRKLKVQQFHIQKIEHPQKGNCLSVKLFKGIM